MNEQFVLDLSKTFELNLTKAGVTKIPVLRTRAAFDRSGSMHDNFAKGFAQRAVDLYIAAALKFDDNGELEIGFFNHTFTETPVAVLSDAGKYMQTKGRAIRPDGGTAFHPIVEWTQEEDTRGAEESQGFFGALKSALFGGNPKSEPLPDCGQYIGVVTDGRLESAAARDAFEAALSEVDPLDSFFQFIGIGTEVDVVYLRKIADRFPNVSFEHVLNPLKFDDNSFYEKLSNAKFVKWIDAYNKAKGFK